MSDTLSTALLLPLVLFFVLLVPEFLMYGNLTVKANAIATDTVQLAEKVGGFEYAEDGASVNLGDYIEEQFERNNLNPEVWSYEYTEGKVDYNQPMQVVVRGQYNFGSFFMLGKEEDWEFDFTLPVVVSRSGIGQVYFR
ncbi:DUF4320 family protein [Virgibacillus halodenitrificans]|uniref:DUF4320 family protein n=1 Tax=Virgibacillus halodenitrificans TaxID=1482 RepID=UPI000EF51603|nr:DUF4320 family protein [Virgibacillus halodenitrificans]